MWKEAERRPEMDERTELVPHNPPYSIEAEQSVIASMLYSADAIGDVGGLLTGDDFYQHQYGIMFDTIMELNEKGVAIDPVTLQNALKEKDVAPEVYSIDTLRELANQVFSTANARSYALIVAEKAQMRRMIRTFEDLTNQLYLGKESTRKIMDDVEKRVFDLLEKRTENTTEPISKVVVNTINEIQEAAKNRGGLTGLETGFTMLDRFTNGFQKSNLIILAGRPAMGKTAFALNMADYFTVKKGYPTVLFELEMSREQLCKRILAMESHISSTKLRSGDLNEREWEELVNSAEMLSKSSLIIDDTSGISLSELRTRCRRYKLENKIECIIIDYMQLMSGSGRGNGSRESEISEISRGLKGIARELDVPVIALAQLSRKPDDRSDHRPMLSDLRDSGAIEQDADIVMFIYRDEVYDPDTKDKGIAELLIAKNRAGEIGKVRLSWIAELTKFANLEYNQDDYRE